MGRDEDKEDLEKEIEALRKRVASAEADVAYMHDALETLSQRVALPAPELKPDQPATPPPIPPSKPQSTPEPSKKIIIGPAKSEKLSVHKPAPEPIAKKKVEPPPEPTAPKSKPEPAKPDSKPKPKPPRENLETQIGTVWFTRIGLVALMIGFALLARLIHPHLANWHKVAVSYLAAAVLFFIGRKLFEKLGAFARPVMAGGVALAFFTSFAAHFVPPMHCVGLWTSLFLMSLTTGWLFWCAERWGSEPTAGLSIFLGHVAVFVAGGEANSFSLIAILILSGAAIALFLRHDWLPLSVFSVLAAFFSHLFWYLRDPTDLSMAQILTLNLLFLSAYYLLFTVSDLIYQKRLRDQGTARFTLKQRIAGRMLGPSAMTLYVAFTIGLFAHTEIHWDVIHRFLFPVAFVQLALVWLHRDLRNPDYPFYTAVAALLFTLGLFSWCDGLTLNLALAFEALLLLLLSRRGDFWFLSPLAQIVLAVNFLHYWQSDASAPASLPAWMGGIATVVVYAVKGRLEETWSLRTRETDIPKPVWLIRMQSAYKHMLFPLALLHMLAAVILAAHQTQAYFHAGDEALILALLACLAGAAAIFLRSRVLPFLGWGMQLAAFLFIVMYHGTTSAFWLTLQCTALLLVLSATLFALLTRTTDVAMTRMFALGSYVPATLAASFAPFIGAPFLAGQWLPLLAPLILWGKAQIHAAPHLPNTGPGPWGSLDTRARQVLWAREPWRYAFAVGAAAATWSASVGVWDASPTGLRIILVAMLALLFASVKLQSTPLALGLLALQAFTLFDLRGLGGVFAQQTSPLLAWSMGAIYALAAARTGGEGNRSGDRMLRAVGYGHVILLVLFIPVVLEVNGDLIQHTLPWLVLLGLGLYALERLDWSARASTSDYRDLQLFGGALFGAGLAALACMVVQHTFETAIGAARMELFLTGVLLLLALSLRSMPLAVAGGVTLIAAHLLSMIEIELFYAAQHYAWFTALLAISTLAVGAGAETLYTSWREGLTSKRRVSMDVSIWLAYTLGLIVLSVLGIERAGDRYALGITALLILPFLYVACRLLLLRFFTASSIYIAIVVAVGIPLLALDLENQAWISGLLVALTLVIAERFLMRLHRVAEIPKRKQQLFLQHQVMVIAAAGILLATFYGSAGTRGSWATLGWSASALSLMALGFWWKDATYRRTALGFFLLCIARIVIVDTAQLELFYRTLAYIALGVCLLFASYLYTRFKDEISKWLE